MDISSSLLPKLPSKASTNLGAIQWRDDPARAQRKSEDELTSQLCRKLNSLARRAVGWDNLHFERETPDELSPNRNIDIAVVPLDVISVESRSYDIYDNLLMIECKRLPTPKSSKRDPREYLYSKKSSTGGVQRFKAGHHARDHQRAFMIGYIQKDGIEHWQNQLDSWVTSITADGVANWSDADRLTLKSQDNVTCVACLHSSHERAAGLPPILVDHLWIEMFRNTGT
ncbi:hypothetical protein [Cypionkella psychrotolerans]|uniref:hypothetical protein n=1 Tax=Cypionkella psychrotolerans TaxID=1678131 RepID=UPI0012E227FB|nr:hypothetical protein [Cypionkella psychrotolerans]